MKMVNPYKLASELNEKEWLWKTAKWEMIIVGIVAVIILVGILVDPVVHGALSLLSPAWYLLYLKGKRKLYLKNVMLFENWEALYGPTVKKRNS